MRKRVGVLGCAVAALPFFADGGTAQERGGAAPSEPITHEAFSSLSWLVGRWRGSGGGFDAFYEEYVRVDDVTLEQRTFPDSTFSTPDGISRIVWRDGTAEKVRDGVIETRIAWIHGDTARFEPVLAGRRGFTWHRVSDGEWRAILQGPAGPRIYTLTRIDAGSGRATDADPPPARARIRKPTPPPARRTSGASRR